MDLKFLLLENRGTKQTIIKNTFWLTLSTVFSYILGFFFIAYVARIFAVADYGRFNFVFSLLSFLIVFVDLGTNQIITREIAKDTKKEREYIGVLLSLKTLLSLIFLVLVFGLSFFINSLKELQSVILVLAVYSVLNHFINFFNALFRGRQKMQYEAVFQIFNITLLIGSGFLFLLKDPSIFKLGLVYLIGAAITLFAIFILYERKFNSLNFHFNRNLWKKLLSLSWPVALIGIFATVYHSIDSIMLGMWGMMEENGLYTAAYKIFDIAVMPVTLISTSFFPVFSRVFGHLNLKSCIGKYSLSDTIKSLKEKEEVFVPSLSVLAILGLPLVVGGIILAPKIIETVFGAKYLGGVFSFQVLMLALFIIYLNNSFASALFAANFQKVIFWIAFSGAVLNITLNFILIPLYTLNGAAIATFITYLLDWLVIMYFSKKLLGLTLFNNRTLKTFLSCLIGLFFMVFLITAPLILKLNIFLVILIGGAVYFAVIFLFNKIFKLGLI